MISDAAELIPLLDRYLAGDCTRSEAELVRARLAADAEVQAQLAILQQVRAVAQDTPADWDIEKLWNEARGRFVESSSPIAHLPVAKPRSALAVRTGRHAVGHTAWMWSTAAVAVAGILIALGLRSSHSRIDAALQDATTLVQTASAQRASTQLPDGTRVVLAPNTTLRYRPDLGGDERTVWVDGEAHFTVPPASKRAFVVHGRHSIVRVLGTVFNVRAYGSDSLEVVTVANGKVSVQVRDRSASAILSANDVAQVAADGSTRVLHDAHVQAQLGWIDGTLVFDNTPLSDVVAVLARWYGLEIRLASPQIGTLPLTSSFGDEPVGEVLDAVALATGTRYRRDGNVIVFTTQAAKGGR